MGTDYYNFDTEISPLGTLYARAHFAITGEKDYPIDPEIIAMKCHGLEIRPIAGLSSINVKAGIDATQSVLFVDQNLYMSVTAQHITRQIIAHELGHIIFDSTAIRRNVPSTVKESFAAHTALTQYPGLETRANMFAGSFLVPRHELIKRSAQIILNNIIDLKRQHANMLVSDVITALAASKLTNQFDVSQQVIEWRLESEKVAELLGGIGARVVDLDEDALYKLADIEEAIVPLSERIKRLLPQEMLMKIEELGI